MGSVFMSPHYEAEPVTRSDLIIASLAWGFTLGFSYLTSVKAARQTLSIWRRSKRVTVYVALIWLEMLVSTIFGFICWFYLNGSFPPSFAFFFSILTLWALQVQFLLQIIINRIAILIPNKRKVLWIKWGTAALITAVNISVYNIWIPARLQTSERYIHINEWWDRCEKGIYLIVDGILNAYFLWLVKSRLLSAGMSKYKPLFNFNACIVVVSLSMDVLIISMMSLKNTFVYMQFHPVAYIVKLKIEMTMAELITKVAREPNKSANPGYGYRMPTQPTRTWNGSAVTTRNSGGFQSANGHGIATVVTKPAGGEFEHSDSRRYHAWVDADSKHGDFVTIEEKRIGLKNVSDFSDEESGISHIQEDDNDVVYGENIVIKTFERSITTESIHQSGASDTGSTVKLTV